MDGTRAAGRFIPLSQQDQSVLDARRRRAARFWCGSAQFMHGRRRWWRRAGRRFLALGRRDRGCGWEDLIPTALSCVLNRNGSVRVDVAARTCGHAPGFAESGTASLQSGRPARCLDGAEEKRLGFAEPTDFYFPVLRSHLNPLLCSSMIPKISWEVASRVASS